MLCCLLQEATTCTKDSSLQAKYYAYQEDEDQVVMRFCKDTFHGEGFAVFFVAPFVPSSKYDHIFGEDGNWSFRYGLPQYAKCSQEVLPWSPLCTLTKRQRTSEASFWTS